MIIDDETNEIYNLDDESQKWDLLSKLIGDSMLIANIHFQRPNPSNGIEADVFVGDDYRTLRIMNIRMDEGAGIRIRPYTENDPYLIYKTVI